MYCINSCARTPMSYPQDCLHDFITGNSLFPSSSSAPNQVSGKVSNDYNGDTLGSQIRAYYALHILIKETVLPDRIKLWNAMKAYQLDR